MTEGEWLECSGPRRMLDSLRDAGMLTERKARLFSVACCRRIWPLITHDAYRNIVEVAEGFADGQADVHQMNAVEQSAYDTAGVPGWNHALWAALNTLSDSVLLSSYYDGDDASYYHAGFAVAVACGEWEEPVYREPDPQKPLPLWEFSPAESHREGRVIPMPEAANAEYRAQADLLREMFGNLFRPQAIDPSWLTPEVVLLAEEIYDKRAFGRMPELATVLEQAGCTNADILAHCKAGGQHVRGCWVLDLILSKDR